MIRIEFTVDDGERHPLVTLTDYHVASAADVATLVGTSMAMLRATLVDRLTETLLEKADGQSAA